MLVYYLGYSLKGTQLFLLITVNQSTPHTWLWHAVQLHQNEDREHCISDMYKMSPTAVQDRERLRSYMDEGTTWDSFEGYQMSSTVIFGCPRHSDSVLMCFDCCGFFSSGWVHRLSMFNLQLTPGYLGVLLPQHASYSVQRQSLAEERIFFKFLSAAGPRALEPLSCLRGL